MSFIRKFHCIVLYCVRYLSVFCQRIHCAMFFIHTALKLPNTFQSWFLVAHLHLWMCLVRLKREGKDGHFMIRELVSTFWEDVKQRMSMLGVCCVVNTTG